MAPLADAAVCRSESDWLVGINGTRAMTAFNSKGGGFQLTPVGRVQTPTLAILAEREDQHPRLQAAHIFEVFGDLTLFLQRVAVEGREAIAAAGSMRISRRMATKTRGRTHLGEGNGRSDRGKMRGQDRHHRGGKETDHADRRRCSTI